jgi:4-amino-4-deoxy-L-arabinose transferase-like glycosyltransferase
VIAAALRLWNLGSVPPGLTPDEASLGYNAYSLIRTGHDEYGKYFPIIFKSFGDFKPGLYVYLTIPTVAFFGLNEFSTRLPSALAGIMTVFLIFRVVKLLFPDKKNFPLIVAFVAATNPWLIYFSRGAWEANVSLILTLAGVYFFLKALGKSQFIIFSALFFALTLLTYQGAKLSTAIVVLILTIIYWKEILNTNKKHLMSGIVLGGIISLPIIFSLFNGQSSRLAVFSIFSYHRPPEEIQKYSGPLYNIFHSEPLNYVRAIAGRWFNVFSGNFLFFEGDNQNPIHTAPYQGVLLLSDLIFLPIGFYAFFKKKLQKEHLFILLWLILAPLSAAISRDTTSAVRSLNTAVPLIIIISFGLSAFLEEFKSFGIALAFTFYLLAFTYFADAYFIHVPSHYSNYWRYGYRQSMNYILENKSKYNKIIFEQSYNQPYIYYLFYSREIARTNLTAGENIKDVGLVNRIGNIIFEKIDWQVVKSDHGVLVVASPISLPPNFSIDAKLVEEIKYLNDRDVAFDIIEVK